MPTHIMTHSFLDVLDNYLGTEASGHELLRLGKTEVETAADHLLEFYDAWAPPAVSNDLVRVFVETHRVVYVDWFSGKPVPRPPIQHLLYVDQLVIEDPITKSAAILRGRRRGSAHWTLVQRVMASAAEAFKPCRPLIASDSLILLPGHALEEAYQHHGGSIYELLNDEAERYERRWREESNVARGEARAIAQAMARDAPEEQEGTYDVIWTGSGLGRVFASTTGSDPYYDSPWLMTDDTIRSVSAAAHADARFVPTSVYGDATYRAILRTVLPDPDHAPVSTSLQLHTALVSAVLPMFTGLPPSTLVEVRENEAAFQAWRAELRSIARAIGGAGARHLESTQDVLADALLPRIAEVRATVSRNARLRRASIEAAMAFSLGAATAGVQTGDLSTTLLATGATSAAASLFRALFPPATSPLSGILLRLVPHMRISSGRR